MTLNELNIRFAIPSTVKFDTGNGGLTRVLLTGPRGDAEIYLHGAHVTHFQPRGQKPLIWVSSKSNFTPGKPIRGGVPICFPWFGPKADDPSAPMHGLARLTEWSVLETKLNAAGDPEITFGLELLNQYSIRYTITAAAKLEMAFHVRNIASSPVTFEEALHTYLPVADIRKTTVTGLENIQYISKVHNGQIIGQGDTPITFTGETDRVYLNTQSTCLVHDAAGNRTLSIEKTGSNTTVVWNPWIDKAKAMPDFGDDEWPSMLCVETCNVKHYAVTLPPGQSHTLRAIIGVAK